MNIGEGRFSEFDGELFIGVFSAEIQDNPGLLDEPYSPFHAEFGMSAESDFGDFISRDDMSLCDRTDHSLSLFLKRIAWTCDVTDRSVISSYE
jgi:hypothetical protein